MEPVEYQGSEESNRFEQLLFRALIEDQISMSKKLLHCQTGLWLILEKSINRCFDGNLTVVRRHHCLTLRTGLPWIPSLSIIAPTDETGWNFSELGTAYHLESDPGSAVMDIAARADGTASLPLPAAWVGDEVETYEVFASEEGALVSDSRYTGRVTVIAAGG